MESSYFENKIFPGLCIFPQMYNKRHIKTYAFFCIGLINTVL